MGVKRRKELREREERLGGKRVGSSDLVALEKTHRTKLEGISTSRSLTPEGKHEASNETRAEFRQL